MNEREAASYIQHLEAEVAKLKAEIEKRGVEIDRLKNEKGLTREDLTFNTHTGLYADASGQLYCPTCLNADKRNPVRVERGGWRCTAGGHYFRDQDYRAPPLDTGGGHWMA